MRLPWPILFGLFLFVWNLPPSLEGCAGPCNNHTVPINCGTCLDSQPPFLIGADCQPERGAPGDTVTAVQCGDGDPRTCSPPTCINAGRIKVWTQCDFNHNTYITTFAVCCSRS